MAASPSPASCPRLRVFYRGGLRGAALSAVSALLLSNSLRCWVVYTAVVEPAGVAVELDGARLRGLRPGLLNAEGFLRSVLRGDRWPGARLSSPPPRPPPGCAGLEEAARSRRCTPCILVDEARCAAGFKPWWLLAAVMVAQDARCGCRGSGGAGEEGRLDSGEGGRAARR